MSTLLEKFNYIGAAKLKTQRLLDCLRESKTDKKGVTTITFQTDVIHTNELMFGGTKAEHIGIIVWVPAAEATAADEALGKGTAPVLTQEDITALVKAAGTFHDQNVGDRTYDVREREGLGWDGPKVVAWGAACETLTRLRKEGKV